MLASKRVKEGNETTRLDEALKAISAQGRERGFVTSQDLLQGLPVEDLSPEQVEGFLTDVQEYLRKEGIEVLKIPGEESEGEGEDPPGIRQGRDDIPANDAVRMYLKDIGRVPLLAAAQEVDLAMRIEAGGFAAELLASIDSANRLDEKRFRLVVYSVLRIREHQLDPKNKLQHEGIGLEKVTRAYRPRTRAEAIQFLQRVEGDDHIAKKRLIEANLRLVVSIAKRYTSHGMTFLDLTQEGNVGLIRAVEKFDYTRGYKFSTYATWWIRQAITRPSPTSPAPSASRCICQSSSTSLAEPNPTSPRASGASPCPRRSANSLGYRPRGFGRSSGYRGTLSLWRPPSARGRTPTSATSSRTPTRWRR